MFKLKTLNSITVALISGIFMGLTVAPVNAWFLAWIALAPLWVLVVTAPQKITTPLFLSLAWGVGYHGIALFWITGIHPMTWMGVPWLASLAIAIFCLCFITLWGVALVASWAISLSLINRRSRLTSWVRVLIGTAIWCGLEALWNAGPLDWSNLAYTQSPYNLAILHLGQISGPGTVSAAIVAVNGLIAEAWMSRKEDKKLLYMPFVFCLVFHLIGFSLYNLPLNQLPETALKVGIIQGNVPNQIKLYPEGLRRAIAGYTTGYLNLADQKVDAVLTPEGALPFYQSELLQSAFVKAVKEKGVVAWIGAFGEIKGGYTNSLFTITGKGEIFSRYNKVKLVPIGEYVPFENIIGGLIKRLSPLDEHQIAGVPNQIFDTPFGRAIAAICYGSAFPEQFRYQAAAGGQFILSPSNDAHYSAAMPAQHHAQDTMRAIETDRWAVRATNTGYSAFVDPHGKTIWMSGHNTYEVHAATIYRRQTQTLYVRWGNWLTPLLLILSASWLVMAMSKSDHAQRR